MTRLAQSGSLNAEHLTPHPSLPSHYATAIRRLSLPTHNLIWDHLCAAAGPHLFRKADVADSILACTTYAPKSAHDIAAALLRHWQAEGSIIKLHGGRYDWPNYAAQEGGQDA